MQKQNQKNDFTREEVEEYHRELVRAEARIRKSIFSTKKHDVFGETFKFGITTAIIFAITFVGMNMGAYSKQAKFFLSNLSSNEIVEEESAEGSGKLAVKKVESEAEREFKLPPMLEEISPPDNRLIIQRLGIHAPIKTAQNINLAVSSWEDIENQIQDALRDGVVSFPGTANPGERGNAFITGHSSYYPLFPGRYKDIFALLPEIEIGEIIEVWQNQQKFIYRVSDKREVSPRETSVLDTTDDSRLTLMTCTPLGTALRRLIVTAELVENT